MLAGITANNFYLLPLNFIHETVIFTYTPTCVKQESGTFRLLGIQSCSEISKYQAQIRPKLYLYRVLSSRIKY